jgi:signal transduction histidine kinase
MRFVPRSSVRIQLALAILVAITLSWVVSGGVANYIGFLQISAIHQEMVNHPELYPHPMPAPTFGIAEFFFGPRRHFGGHPGDGPPPSELDGRFAKGRQGFEGGQYKGGPPPFEGSGGMPSDHSPSDLRHPAPLHGRQSDREPPLIDVKLALARLLTAVLLAILMGKWLSIRFTKPLAELSSGASAYHSGDFKYRIPTRGDDEFSDVARAMNDMAERVSAQIANLEDDAVGRRQFLADVAHELRSPVTTMCTMAGALAQGLASDPQRTARATEALVRTSERLLRLVTDLMELAKLDLKELPLRLVDVDLKKLVTSAVQSHMDDAGNAWMTLQTIEPMPSVITAVDPDRITQVLDNILDNAISYAGEGAAITVSLEDADPIRITTADNGRGIPAGHTQRVFDSFYRVDAARSPMDSHSGLGLRITRGIVEAHGGTIELTSAEGKGTTVVITLPKRLANISTQ